MRGPHQEVCFATQAEQVQQRAIRDIVVVETTFVIDTGSAADAIKHLASHEERLSLYISTCGSNK
jgi:hypothetical protein